MDRRSLMFRIAPALALGGAFAGTAKTAVADPVSDNAEASGDCATCGAAEAKFASYEEFEAAFEELGRLSDEEVEKFAKQATGELPTPRIPLPGPAAIVSCVLSAAWIFRKGTSKNKIMMQLADVVMSCVGIPAATGITIRVARLIWKYKGKIIAALSAAGLTAAQLAPLKNAPKP